MTRRRFILMAGGAALAAATSRTWARTHAPPPLARRVDDALRAAAAYLVARQSPDGAWRSRDYGILNDGFTLTPHVLAVMYYLNAHDERARASFLRGLRYQASLVRDDDDDDDDDDDGSVDFGRFGSAYPVYTAAQSAWAMALEVEARPKLARPMRAYLKLLRHHQLTEELGWTPEDVPYGGWGYAVFPPKKGQNGAWPAVSNLSATLFALGALRKCKVDADDPAYAKALRFVHRCQNLDTDGGFFLSPTEVPINKAGTFTDCAGAERPRSYGSMTADGLRALLACGAARDDDRVLAARAWLEHRFDAGRNPGTFGPTRELTRDSTYYYWCWSAAHALTRLGVRRLRAAAGEVDWPEALARALVSRQRPADGAFANPANDGKEDDPLVATPLAVAALYHCRMQMEG